MDQDAGRRVQELSLARRIRRALDWPIWGAAGQEIHCATKGAPQEGEVPGRINRFVKEIRDRLRRKIYLDIVRGSNLRYLIRPRWGRAHNLGNGTASVGFTHGCFIRPRWGRHNFGNCAASVGFTHGCFIRPRRGSRTISGMAPPPWVPRTPISFDPAG